MLRLLPAPVRGVLTATLLGLNTLFFSLAMVPPALLKLVLPDGALRQGCTRAIAALASAWVAVNNGWIGAVSQKAWDVQGTDGMKRQSWYLVSPNHQTWVDILVLQRVFHGRIPFLKFFLKKELIWVPVIGLVWWALDFPFMARGKGRASTHDDLRSAREACEKFMRMPTTVINFVEGTRHTPAKHQAQGSPYHHLLKPKTGGLGVALSTMGSQFEALLDVTLVYPDGVPTFWQLLCGQAGAVVVRVQQRPIPPDLCGGDPMTDKALRRRTAAWVDMQWSEKDLLIDELKGPRR